MARGSGQHAYVALPEGAAPPRQARLREEYERADRALKLFDEARELAAHAGDARSDLGQQAERHAWRIVREGDPVRLSYAARVLDVADQTVRDWVDAGLLEDFGGTPQRVGLESVARVRELVRDLRSSGQQRDLMTAVLRALELEELQRDDRFRASVEQMHRGERA